MSLWKTGGMRSEAVFIHTGDKDMSAGEYIDR